MAQLTELTNQHIRPLLQLNDELFRLTQHEESINVTTIVAVGDQSSGKTSVIEALSGINLPRGDGIVTRVPLLLKLRDAKEGAEHAILKPLHPDDGSDADCTVEISDLATVAEHVERLTNELAGASKAVVNKPLELTVFRSEQMDLTLIDLPGITRLARDDQSEDIEEKITDMYNVYMKPKEAVLLNVVNATTDATASASLKLSRKMDPDKERTLVVLTKIDLCQGNAADKALHSVIELCGEAMVFPVRNRSQHECEEGVSLEEARRLEKELLASLFLGDPEARGIAGLTKRLVQLQAQRIRATLPAIKTAVAKALDETQARLAILPEVPASERAAWAELTRRLEVTTRQLQAEVRGEILDRDSTKRRGLLDDYAADGTTVILERGSPEIVNFNGILLQLSLRDFSTIHGLRHQLQVSSISLGLPSKPDSAWPPDLVLLGRAAYECEGNNFDLSFQVTEESGTEIPLARFSSEHGLTVTLIEKSRTAVEESGMLLCAKLDKLAHTCSESLEKRLARQHSRSTFFSADFHQRLLDLWKSRRGGAGLPGTVPAEIQLEVLSALRKPLPDVVKAYVNNVAVVVKKTCISLLAHAFAGLPLAKNVVLQVLDTYFRQQNQLALERASDLLEWEQDIATVNHYYMDIVAKVRTELRQGNVSLTMPGFSGPIPADEIKKLSNESQALLELQIKLWAYWKVMLRRLTDTVIMATRYYLVRLPLVERGLAKAIENAFDQHAVLDLVIPSKSQQEEVGRLQERLGRLKQAAEKIDQAVTAGALTEG